MAAGNRSPQQLQPGSLEVDAAKRVASQATERERGYIDAVSQLYDKYETIGQRNRVVSYEHAMADLVAKQPADTEAGVPSRRMTGWSVSGSSTASTAMPSTPK